tara:strand:+ start:615 stop:941 length:327 start_codon:yes stop_codon:yes gene_type:complete
MNKPSSLIWMVFALLLILPTPAGKLIVDLAGGLFLVITFISIILGGLGWIAWKRIQSQVQTCEVCGTNFLNNQLTCPVCGRNTNNNKDNYENIPASSATIDVTPETID